jgi:hypothetical protein
MEILNIFKKTFILLFSLICSIALFSCEDEQQEPDTTDKTYVPEYLKEIMAKIVENNPNGFEIDNEWFRYYRYSTRMRYGKITYANQYELVGLGTSIGDELGSISQFYAKNIQTSYDERRYANEIVYQQVAKAHFKRYSYYCFYTESRYSSISEKLEVVKEKSIGSTKIKDTEYLDFNIYFLNRDFVKNCNEILENYEFYTNVYGEGYIFEGGPQTLKISLVGGRVSFSYFYDDNYRITKIIDATASFSKLGDNGEFNTSSYYSCIELISPEKIQVPTEYDEEYICEDGEDKKLYLLPLEFNYITY